MALAKKEAAQLLIDAMTSEKKLKVKEEKPSESLIKSSKEIFF